MDTIKKSTPIESESNEPGLEDLSEEEMEETRKVGSDTNESIAFYPPAVKKKGHKKLFIIASLILVLLIAAFFLRHKIKGIVLGGPKTTPTPTSTPLPTPTPNPLNKSEWSLEVLNGTTTLGQAKKLADKLKEIGYPVVKTGNADKQTYAQSQIFVKKDLLAKVDLLVADLKDIIKISSVAGELKEATASARIIIGKDFP